MLIQLLQEVRQSSLDSSYPARSRCSWQNHQLADMCSLAAPHALLLEATVVSQVQPQQLDSSVEEGPVFSTLTEQTTACRREPQQNWWKNGSCLSWCVMPEQETWTSCLGAPAAAFTALVAACLSQHCRPHPSCLVTLQSCNCCV
jgi:hypothetical protein